ncbi:MAG: hypothetical protein KZQ72_13625, partial [Candidatus Thiodiazotropha sp. (ex Cardiolucina cf. quadrata)]|nr:hypothetical protein [Candidatus Thiodiazotropha sp. (ex Cardiolucina cf. quadrata)]
KARRVYSLASRLPGTNRLGFQPSMALSERVLLQSASTYSDPKFISCCCLLTLSQKLTGSLNERHYV